MTCAESFFGHVEAPDVFWVFFEDNAEKFDSRNEEAATAKAKAAY